MHYYVYLDANRQWRWTLYAANNRKIANAGEGYHKPVPHFDKCGASAEQRAFFLSFMKG
jgi:hypothetical protein